MRHTRSHTRNRRSHHALSEPRLSQCSHCKAMHVRHKVCSTCGYYRGRLVVDVLQKAEKKAGAKRDQAGVKESKKDDKAAAEQKETKKEAVAKK